MRLTTISLWFTVIVGALLTGASFWITQDLENQNIRLEQSRTSTLFVDKMKLELDSSINILNGIRGLYLASDNVTRDEFRVFTHNYLKQHPEIQALEWIPKILANERNRYIQLAISDGLDSFQITEIGPDGNVTPANPRDSYYPVYFAEPLEKNRKALGFDLSSNTTRQHSLEQAMLTGQPQATASIKLIQETGSQKGVLFFVPVYKSPASTPEERLQKLNGFASGVFRIEDLFNTAQKGLEQETLDLVLTLTDITNSAQPDILDSIHHYRSPVERGQ